MHLGYATSGGIASPSNPDDIATYPVPIFAGMIQDGSTHAHSSHS